MVVGIIIAVIVVLIVLWAVSAYNGLVTLRNRVKNGWAQIDVQLKQRTDLIPNLVETVKGYAAHESQVFTQVTQARAGVVQAAQSGDVAQRIAAENQLSRALVNLQVVSEKLSAAAGQYEFHGFAESAEIVGREDRLRTPVLQRCRAEVQYPDRGCADQYYRRLVPFRTGPLLPGGRSGSSGSASYVLTCM